MIRLLAISICCTFSLLGYTQANISGIWEGTLDQKYGEHFSKYKITFHITQDGDKVLGTSYIEVDDIFAEMSFVGTYRNDVLTFREKEILREFIPEELAWCIKEGALWIEIDDGQFKMVGPWTGRAGISPCQRGRISVSKALPRA